HLLHAVLISYLQPNRPPHDAPLFPYTTLFRSLELTPYRETYKVGAPLDILLRYKYDGIDPNTGLYKIVDFNQDGRFDINDRTVRSEEHTSELQSRENLVCRLLLEKKNDSKRNI